MIINELLSKVKNDISSGRITRNGKLPVREELGQHYGVSKTTVQKVFAALEKEGFIISRGSLGTFVNPLSPDRTDIAVVLPAGYQATNSNSLYLQFESEKATLEKVTLKRFKTFYVDNMRMDDDDFEGLAEDAQAMRFCGAFFPFAPLKWMYAPFIKHNIPVVSLTDEEIPGISTIWVNYSDMLCKMLEECKNSNCKSPALLSSARLPYHHIIDYKQKAAELGFDIADSSICGLADIAARTDWLKHQISALFCNKNHPDALLLQDELYLFSAYSALLELGIVPGRDVKIISQRTFPGVSTAPEQVSFIGFDLFEIMNAAVEALDSIEPVHKIKLISALKK